MNSINTGLAGSTRFALLSGAAIVSLVLPSMALAQDTDAAADEEFEDENVIIVTATKREQTLQETPISVSVTSGETLERAQIRDVFDLQTVTPSLSVDQNQSSSNSTFIIRGFGNGANNFGIEPSVGVFVDGVFRSRSIGALGDLTNVSRIEVLRGPQSTLFGKNASAGVISVVTREPQYDFSGSIEASYGNYNDIGFKADITGPIGENIAYSLDASYNKSDGYAKISNLDEDINDRNRWALRGQLLVEPDPDLKVRAIVDYSRIDEKCCIAINVVAGPTAAAVEAVGGQIDAENPFSYNTFLNQEPINEVDNYGGSVQFDWNTGPLSITLLTAYRELENYLNQDVDFTSADVVNESRRQKVNTYTQEVRIASDFDGPLNFLLGGFVFDESIDQVSDLTTGAVARPFFELLGGGLGLFTTIETALGLPANSIFSPGLLTSEVYSMDNTSWSIFGTADFELFDGLVLTGGFNYTDDKKSFALAQQSYDELGQVNLADAFIAGATSGAVTTAAQFAALPAANQAALRALATTPCSATAPPPNCNALLGLSAFQFQPPFLNLPNAVEPGKTANDELTYTIRAAYDISPDVNGYISYATGFKASSVNLSRDSRPSASVFTPGPAESTILAPPSPITNAGLAVPNLTTGSRFAGPEDATVWEVGLKAQFEDIGFNIALFDQSLKGFQGFLFTGTGFQLSNAGERSAKGIEFDTTFTPTDGLIFTFAMTYLDALFDDFKESPVGDISGTEPSASDLFLSTSATYIHTFESGTQLTTRIDYSHESNAPLARAGLATFGPGASIFTREVNLVNASMTLALNNGLEIGAYARNLFNDEHLTAIFDGVAQAGTISGYPNQPRTYGAVARFKF